MSYCCIIMMRHKQQYRIYVYLSDQIVGWTDETGKPIKNITKYREKKCHTRPHKENDKIFTTPSQKIDPIL